MGNAFHGHEGIGHAGKKPDMRKTQQDAERRTHSLFCAAFCNHETCDLKQVTFSLGKA